MYISQVSSTSDPDIPTDTYTYLLTNVELGSFTLHLHATKSARLTYMPVDARYSVRTDCDP